jgi:hypothetical protein
MLAASAHMYATGVPYDQISLVLALLSVINYVVFDGETHTPPP